MTYTLHYHIVSVYYDEDTRATDVTIINESTGELFYGQARRHPADECDLALGINLATARAVRKAMDADLADEESTIIRHSESNAFYL